MSLLRELLELLNETKKGKKKQAKSSTQQVSTLLEKDWDKNTRMSFMNGGIIFQ